MAVEVIGPEKRSIKVRTAFALVFRFSCREEKDTKFPTLLKLPIMMPSACPVTHPLAMHGRMSTDAAAFRVRDYNAEDMLPKTPNKMDLVNVGPVAEAAENAPCPDAAFLQNQMTNVRLALSDARLKAESGALGAFMLAELLTISEEQLTMAQTEYTRAVDIILAQRAQLDQWEAWFLHLNQVLDDIGLMEGPLPSMSDAVASQSGWGESGSSGPDAAATATSSASSIVPGA